MLNITYRKRQTTHRQMNKAINKKGNQIAKCMT